MALKSWLRSKLEAYLHEFQPDEQLPRNFFTKSFIHGDIELRNIELKRQRVLEFFGTVVDTIARHVSDARCVLQVYHCIG